MEQPPLPEPKLKYLSPTSLNWFEKDIDKFVLYYVCGERRDGQTRAMAMGSGFDARIKGEVEADLIGVPNRWKELFDTQVDSQHRTYVAEHSEIVLQDYKKCGAYAALLKSLESVQGSPKLEFDLSGTITVEGLNIPIFGKPDFYCELAECLYILDWKLNGYMSKASPAKGYVALRSMNGHNSGPHRDIMAFPKHGLLVASGSHMREDWQTQLLFYQWMQNANPHKPWIACIEQLAYDSDKQLRVATHRVLIPQRFEDELRQRVYRVWKAITDRHYYLDRSKEESDERVRQLFQMDACDKWILLQ